MNKTQNHNNNKNIKQLVQNFIDGLASHTLHFQTLPSKKRAIVEFREIALGKSELDSHLVDVFENHAELVVEGFQQHAHLEIFFQNVVSHRRTHFSHQQNLLVLVVFEVFVVGGKKLVLAHAVADFRFVEDVNALQLKIDVAALLLVQRDELVALLDIVVESQQHRAYIRVVIFPAACYFREGLHLLTNQLRPFVIVSVVVDHEREVVDEPEPARVIVFRVLPLRALEHVPVGVLAQALEEDVLRRVSITLFGNFVFEDDVGVHRGLEVQARSDDDGLQNRDAHEIKKHDKHEQRQNHQQEFQAFFPFVQSVAGNDKTLKRPQNRQKQHIGENCYQKKGPVEIYETRDFEDFPAELLVLAAYHFLYVVELLDHFPLLPVEAAVADDLVDGLDGADNVIHDLHFLCDFIYNFVVEIADLFYCFRFLFAAEAVDYFHVLELVSELFHFRHQLVLFVVDLPRQIAGNVEDVAAHPVFVVDEVFGEQREFFDSEVFLVLRVADFAVQDLRRDCVLETVTSLNFILEMKSCK